MEKLALLCAEAGSVAAAVAAHRREAASLRRKVSKSDVNTFLLAVFAQRKSARFNPEILEFIVNKQNFNLGFRSSSPFFFSLSPDVARKHSIRQHFRRCLRAPEQTGHKYAINIARRAFNI